MQEVVVNKYRYMQEYCILLVLSIISCFTGSTNRYRLVCSLYSSKSPKSQSICTLRNIIMTDHHNEMNASSWIIILLLTCSPFIAFGLASFTIFCCDCNQDGDIVILKNGWRVRKRLIKDSLVTKVRALYG